MRIKSVNIFDLFVVAMVLFVVFVLLSVEQKQSESHSVRPIHAVRSPQKFVVMVEDNTAVILEKLTSLVKQEREIHHRAIQIGSVEDCAAIESARAKADCRGEIYFQKAIIDNNFTLCGKIENKELLSRCQNYFQ